MSDKTKSRDAFASKNYEDLPWTKFKVGRKQKINIQTYLKKCIEKRIYNALFLTVVIYFSYRTLILEFPRKRTAKEITIALNTSRLMTRTKSKLRKRTLKTIV